MGNECAAATDQGLTQAEAARRLADEGPNELQADQRRGAWWIAVDVIREPMFLLLASAGVLYLLMGEHRDATLLLAAVFVVIGITYVQERRTERALDALRRLASPRALVIRDGTGRRIPGDAVVRGDLLVVSEGDRVAADALLRRSTHLAVDESLLTGESVPVDKSPCLGTPPPRPPGGGGDGTVYAGTLVTAGSGLCEVIATGARTEFGRLGRSLDEVRREPTPLQRETGTAVRRLAIAGVLACVFVVVAYALSRGGGPGQWREGALAGITMAMSMLPEEFPVVLTVFLALGAWRLGRHRVLTRRLPAIETLGATTVLCVDKTGTLTRNEMRLAAIVEAGRRSAPPASAVAPEDAAAELLRTGRLASRTHPFDPMERALHSAADTAGVEAPDGARLLREYPLTAERPAVVQAWGLHGRCDLACKGAPEAVAELCRLDAAEREALSSEVTALARDGLRVLAVATAVAEGEPPGDPAAVRFRLLGLLGFADPVREGVPEAMAQCRSAGIRVIMITGDYPATAVAIARAAGIATDGAVITGAELDAMADDELARRLGTASVFARIAPRQKLRLVTSLQARGEVVAMTGDGVNDAPALKAAHIGVAMGGRGSDVAREAADLVLLDDSFASLVAAVRLGRRIYDNIRKATSFILAVHVPIAGLSLLPVLFADWPLLLLPVHIVFLELVIDPTCALVFEAERSEQDLMRRPPRSRGERLFSRPVVVLALLQGASVLAACIAVFLLSRSGHEPDAARGLTFAALVVSMIAMIAINRSWEPTTLRSLARPNRPFWAVAAGALGLLALALGWPAARELFRFAPLHPTDLAMALGAGLACLVWFEVIKRRPAWRPGR